MPVGAAFQPRIELDSILIFYLMKPKKGSELLRKGRASIKNQHYLITTTVFDRKPVFNQTGTAQIVLNSLNWLEVQGQILLDAAVVMPDQGQTGGFTRDIDFLLVFVAG